jgi:hypothetical protein
MRVRYPLPELESTEAVNTLDGVGDIDASGFRMCVIKKQALYVSK